MSERTREAARLRRYEGAPEDECLYDLGYESTECDCPLCWPDAPDT
ncbi:hypothetical protein HNR23_002287 [Nocardiopsis mwathae]|uniref:Uncharacterized protein n=1 Tax=Nocardiopsis mwathae TaxID=1472723 RepID=A0A7W9YHH8_9ACTN|nr:hypothetical protein [Nocardiopsis mwathae]MBB6172227.1 hypothetical protein [Nocardiopsis mwathae]